MMAFLEDLRGLLEQEQEITPASVCEIIAHHWGGESPYIAKRERPVIEPGDTPQSIVRKHHVSRSTAYNWVKKWR